MKDLTGLLIAALIVGAGIYFMSKKLPLGIRQNNPGNLRANGIPWQGLVGEGSGFCIFDTPINGIRALTKDLKKDYFIDGQKTITALITEFAPGHENDTQAYINHVASAAGLSPVEEFEWNGQTVAKIVDTIIRHENAGRTYSAETIAAGLQAAGVEVSA